MSQSSSNQLTYVGGHVTVHGRTGAPVLLIAEAPGPQASKNLTPLFGPMGGALYRGLYQATFSWVLNWNGPGDRFEYPKYSEDDYKTISAKVRKQLDRRREFLDLRSEYIACTNGFDQLPKRNGKVVAPGPEICSPANTARLRSELQLIKPRILLITGRYGYLALTGTTLNRPQSHEGEDMTDGLVPILLKRFDFTAEKVWYIGHPRKWTYKKSGEPASKVLAAVKQLLAW